MLKKTLGWLSSLQWLIYISLYPFSDSFELYKQRQSTKYHDQHPTNNHKSPIPLRPFWMRLFCTDRMRHERRDYGREPMVYY